MYQYKSLISLKAFSFFSFDPFNHFKFHINRKNFCQQGYNKLFLYKIVFSNFISCQLQIPSSPNQSQHAATWCQAEIFPHWIALMWKERHVIVRYFAMKMTAGKDQSCALFLSKLLWLNFSLNFSVNKYPNQFHYPPIDLFLHSSTILMILILYNPPLCFSMKISSATTTCTIIQLLVSIWHTFQELLNAKFYLAECHCFSESISLRVNKTESEKLSSGYAQWWVET